MDEQVLGGVDLTQDMVNGGQPQPESIGNNFDAVTESIGDDSGLIDFEDDTPAGESYNDFMANANAEPEKTAEAVVEAPTTEAPVAQPTDPMAVLQEAMKNPDFVAQLKQTLGMQEVKQTAPAPIALPEFEFTAEDTASPQAFGKAISGKMLAHVQSIIEQKIADVMDYVSPVRQEYTKSLYEKECNAITEAYGESAKPYLTKGTPEHQKLADKYINTPGISLKEALLLVKPDITQSVIKAEANKKANDIIKQKQAASVRVPVQRPPMIKSDNKLMTASEAARRALLSM